MSTFVNCGYNKSTFARTGTGIVYTCPAGRRAEVMHLNTTSTAQRIYYSDGNYYGFGVMSDRNRVFRLGAGDYIYSPTYIRITVVELRII